MILVDTNVLIEILDEGSKKGEEALKRIMKSGEDIALTSLNLHEVIYGLHKYADKAKVEKVLLLDAVDFTKDDASLSAKLEVNSEKSGNKIPRFDAMIAAVAINRGFKFFTFNTKYYEDFEKLKLF